MPSIYFYLIDKILKEIIPETEISISRGNKLFGSAILNKKNLSTICIGTNNEIENPIWHGEISAIKKFYEIPINKRINSSECIFLSTHEPCSLCLSAITWSGFNNFYYFFPYLDTENKFHIPHDLKILKEVFGITKGHYNKNNTYWNSFSIVENVNLLADPEKTKLLKKIKKISEIYDDFSELYQKYKSKNDIPLN